MSQHDTLTLEQIVDNYLSDYELRGEDSEGRDAIHTPSETETFLIKDAILGLLEDDDFKAWNRRAALSATQPAQAAQPVQVVPPELDVRRIMLDIVPGDGDGLEVYAKNVDDVVTKLTKMGERIENLEGAHTAAVAQGAGEVVAWSDDDDNELLHVIGMLERVQVGETVTASDRLYDSSVRPRRMTIKDAQSLVGPCVNILRKLHKKLCAQPAACADVLDAKRWRYAMDWDTKDFAVCRRVGATGTCWEPIKTDGPIDAAIAASGRQE